jgi:hypothetical protein
MISPITPRLFPCAPSPRCSSLSTTSSLGYPLSSASPSRLSSVTMAVSSITQPHVPSSFLTVSSCACLVRIPYLKTARQSA